MPSLNPTDKKDKIDVIESLHIFYNACLSHLGVSDIVVLSI
jgi:hypothetical protein